MRWVDPPEDLLFVQPSAIYKSLDSAVLFSNKEADMVSYQKVGGLHFLRVGSYGASVYMKKNTDYVIDYIITFIAGCAVGYLVGPALIDAVVKLVG